MRQKNVAVIDATPSMNSLSFFAATSVHRLEDLLFFVLVQLAVIVAFARVGGFVARKLGQPRVVGEIVAGLLLGPSLFGLVFPDVYSWVFLSTEADALHILSQIGLVLLMFMIGLEFDFSHLKEKENQRAVTWVSAAGIIVPFGCGFLFGQATASILAPGIPALSYSLFIATALSITAIPILGRIMIEMDLTKTRLGAVAITSAAINDIVGWMLLAVISALAIANFSGGAVGIQLGSLALYFALCWWGLRPLLRRLLRKFKVRPDHLPPDLLAILLAIIFISSIITYKIGIFAIFGGFIVGVLLYDQEEFVAAWKSRISDFVVVFFLPIFFTYTGLRTNVHGLDTIPLWAWCIAVIAVATLGKFVGCYGAARLCGMKHHEAGCLGIMMNTRALMELIVLNVGYDLGVIPQNVFTMLVLMAISSTIITAPALRLWLPKMGHKIPEHRDV